MSRKSSCLDGDTAVPAGLGGKRRSQRYDRWSPRKETSRRDGIETKRRPKAHRGNLHRGGRAVDE